MRILVLALSLWPLVLPAQPEEPPAAGSPPGPSVRPLLQPAPSAPGEGLGAGGGAVPELALPPAPADRRVHGPPPGLGRGYGGPRYRGGPGYPGLRGPGTSYPGHRHYGNPPLYPIRPPGGQD